MRRCSAGRRDPDHPGNAADDGFGGHADEQAGFDDAKGQMIYDVSKSLHEGHGLSRVLYDEAVKVLTERGLVEIIGLCGYYTMVSMTLNTFEFELQAGEVSELA